MRSNLILSIGILASSLTSIVLSDQAKALNTVQEQSSVVEQTTTEGNPTIIQHVDSKMEPTVVQSRLTKDPKTGEKQKIVEPMIMERHDKVLDTTIIQPEVTEFRKTTQQVTSKQATSSAAAADRAITVKRARAPQHFHIAKKKHSGARSVAYSSNHRATTTVKQVTQTTEIERQPVVRETIIQNLPDNNPPAGPQVIQKTESE